MPEDGAASMSPPQEIEMEDLTTTPAMPEVGAASMSPPQDIEPGNLTTTPAMPEDGAAPVSAPQELPMEEAANRLPSSNPEMKLWFQSFSGDSNEIPRGQLNSVLVGTGGVLMIQGMDRWAFNKIKSSPAFRGEANMVAFLHRHAARLSDGECGDPFRWITPAVRLPDRGHVDPRSTRRGILRSPIVEGSETSRGLHFDGLALVLRMPNSTKLLKKGLSFAISPHLPGSYDKKGIEAIVSGVIDTSWNRASTRISCCLLKPELYIVLVDAPLVLPPVVLHKLSCPVLPSFVKNMGDVVAGSLNFTSVFDASGTIQRTFKNFSIIDVLEFMSGNSTPEQPQQGKDVLFHRLLTASEWQSIIDQLDSRLKNLQSWDVGSPKKTTLGKFGTLRRDVAEARELIAVDEKEMLLATGIATSGNVSRKKSGGQVVNYYTYNINKATISENAALNIGAHREEASAEGIDTAMLLDKLTGLEERLEVIAKTVNEEIQLFIASVSVRDSQVILADSKIMKEQAARAFLLTILAVIYLPLQLVTGIFGMNIYEINQGTPRFWTCVAALAVAGTLTAILYIEFERRRREEVKKEEIKMEEEAYYGRRSGELSF